MIVVVLFFAGASAMAQEDRPPNTTVLEEDGTALITRRIDMPTTVSAEAQAILATGKWWCPAAGSPEQLEIATNLGKFMRTRCAATKEDSRDIGCGYSRQLVHFLGTKAMFIYSLQ